MILNPLRTQLCPKLSCWINQSRNVRPSIKIGKEKFQLQLDVRNYDRDEIRVKARPEYVIIEGKQQKNTKRGMVMRQFIRKFKLPTGCVMECMESQLSPEGKLTITAPRKEYDSNTPYETLIPIKACSSQSLDASFVPVQGSTSGADHPNVCAPLNPDETPSPPKL